jgi:hypothetical protein
MEIVRQQGYWKRAEVGLEHRRRRTNIVESVGIPEIKGCIVSSIKELHDRLGLARASCFAIDPLKVERCGHVNKASVQPEVGLTQRFDCFYALFYDDGNLAFAPSQVSSDLVSEVTTKYRGSYQKRELRETAGTLHQTYVGARCHSNLPEDVKDAENMPSGLGSHIENEC